MELPQIKIVEEPETEIISAISDDQYAEEIKDEISLLETMGEIGPDFDLESAIARLEFLIDNLDKSNVLFATVAMAVAVAATEVAATKMVWEKSIAALNP